MLQTTQCMMPVRPALRRVALARSFSTTLYTQKPTSTTPSSASSSTANPLEELPTGPAALKRYDTGKTHGSIHWQFERYLSVALIPLFSAPFIIGPHPYIDFGLAFLLPVHCHLGMQQVVLDYYHKRKHPILSKLLNGLLWTFTLGATYGLYRFNTTDVGITEGVRRVWTKAGSKAN